MSSQAAFLSLLALVALLRILELVVSRARLRARPERLVAEPGLFPAMVLVHVGLIVAPAAEVLLLERPWTWTLSAAAAALLLLATALRIWTLRTLGAAWNVRVVVPDEAQVVTTGPYAWIRHPNYLVVILELAALPLLHGAWISALALSALNGCVLWRRIATEEASLSRLSAWREGMRGRARLIPGVL